MKFNPITLSFTGRFKDLEKSFLDNYFNKYLIQSKILHLVALLFYGSSSIIDTLLFPKLMQPLLIIRFTGCALFLIGFILSFTPLFAKIWQALFAFYVIMTGLSFIVIMAIAPQPLNYSYGVGVIVCMIFGYIFIRARFITALLSCGFLFICYEATLVVVLKPPTPIFIAATYYLTIVTILGSIIAHTLEYNDRKDFFQSRMLEVINHDLADEIQIRLQTEEKLTATLKQKEIYLKEIHHRVKNNLQVISSLLDMTCNRSENPLVQKTLIGARAKIQAMSSVHHQLYRNEDVQKINMDKQIHDLYRNLSMVYGPGSHINACINVKDVYLTLDRAMPCALMINELISNALEHAFAGRAAGNLKIEMQKMGDLIQLDLHDDGIGLPPDLNIEKVESLGLKLVQILVTRQLNGEIEITRTNGTAFSIRFENSAAESNA